MQKNPPKYKKHIIYPFLFALVVFEILLSTAVVGWFTYKWMCDFIRDQVTREDWLILGFFWGLQLCGVGIYVIEGFYVMGSYKLTEDAIILYAPLRRRIKLAFADVKYIGVDYSLIRGKPEFWVYFSKVPIKQKYWNNIAKLRFTRSTVRILYTPERFAEFISILPPHLSKELQKGVSMLRKFKVDTSIDK